MKIVTVVLMLKEVLRDQTDALEREMALCLKRGKPIADTAHRTALYKIESLNAAITALRHYEEIAK